MTPSGGLRPTEQGGVSTTQRRHRPPGSTAPSSYPALCRAVPGESALDAAAPSVVRPHQKEGEVRWQQAR
jgi:hypothetical protein